MGFLFENFYIEELILVFVDKYYMMWNYGDLCINGFDSCGNMSMFVMVMDGVWLDDDIDIEFVMLYVVERYGFDIMYVEIIEMWKWYIN